MMTRRNFLAATMIAAVALQVVSVAAEPQSPAWNQFRGPNGSGVALDCRPPVNLDAAKATWKIDVPPGHSSPVLSRELVFLTAMDGDRLATLAFKKSTGELAWRKHAPQSPPEKVHRAGSPAASTPCVDGDRVYVYFGAYGLLCYDHQGNEQWNKPIPTPKSLYGMSSSPIVHGGNLILVIDNDANLPGGRVSQSKIIALNKTTGELAWETHRPFHRSGWSTPTTWSHEGGTELVVLGNGRLRGYDAATGVEKWYVNGFSRETISRPIVGKGRVIASASMIGGVADEQPDPEPFWKAILQFDANKDNQLERGEMTGHFTFPFRPDLPAGHPGYGLPLPRDKTQRKRRLDGMFAGIDRDKNGFWSKEEFLGRISFNRGKPNLLAVRPGGRGDVTESHVAWALHRGIPEIPTPVFFQDRVYMIADGGILSVVDANDGEMIYRERLGAGGHYRASPIIADDRLYVVSENGVVSVLKTGDEFELLRQHDLGERVAATPAVDATAVYLRAEKRLFAFRAEGDQRR
ncbi:MAG: PQQ-binding-like beta-propeller repeat protein [Planctomycetales bacterium]